MKVYFRGPLETCFGLRGNGVWDKSVHVLSDQYPCLKTRTILRLREELQ